MDELFKITVVKDQSFRVVDSCFLNVSEYGEKLAGSRDS